MSDIIWLALACAVATYVTRFGGHLILSRFGRINHRAEAALDAVPAAVLTALVAPSLVNRGPAESLALILTAAVALRFSLTVTVTVGLCAVVGLRALGL
ncbi:MAG: AzlD domain-containing protein [Pseudomonadota bacterium]